MKLFAIFGDPVHHSKSPIMHNMVFKDHNIKACYTRVHLQDGTKLKKTFLKLKLSGANITVPHKEAAFRACDEVRGFAKKVGVVNTIVLEDGKLIGYNTDADGFMFAIREFLPIQSVLILGAGGTARALAQKFSEEGFEVTILNRSAKRLENFSSLALTTFTWQSFAPKSFDLVVNTTSAGLEDDSLPAPKELLEPLLQQTRFCADAIYGKTTPFLALAKRYNIPSIDGSDMLLGQGVLANELFINHTISKEQILASMQKALLL